MVQPQEYLGLHEYSGDELSQLLYSKACGCSKGLLASWTSGLEI